MQNIRVSEENQGKFLNGRIFPIHPYKGKSRFPWHEFRQTISTKWEKKYEIQVVKQQYKFGKHNFHTAEDQKPEGPVETQEAGASDWSKAEKYARTFANNKRPDATDCAIY